MNKRQKKKRQKIIRERLEFLNKHFNYYVCGRKNGKTFLYRKMLHAVTSKSFKPFKDLKRYLDKIYISIDYSNGRDYTAITHAHID